MLRPDLALRPTAPTVQALQPTPALAAVGRQAHGFRAEFAAVREDVIDFIERGSGGDVAALPAALPSSMAGLSPEGQLARGSAGARVRPGDGAPPAGDAGGMASTRSAQQRAFVAAIAPAAREAAERLGVATELVVAHAALESGWGRQPPRQADGHSSHNLFGIKAAGGWQGGVVRALTTEFEDGAAVKAAEPFRSYADADAAFRDYTRLLLDNPRYRAALNTGSDARAFAEGLMRGGYATDPAYADKLVRVAAQLQGE